MYNIGPIVNSILLTAMRMPNQIANTLSKNVEHCAFCVTFPVSRNSTPLRIKIIMYVCLIPSLILVSLLGMFTTVHEYA